MPEQSNRRLFVFHVLILSLVATLGIRLYALQVLDTDKAAEAAKNQNIHQVVVRAPRGEIVDDVGRPLVDNRTSLVVTVDRSKLATQPDRGKAVLDRLASVLKIPADQLKKTITPCGPKVPKPCWTGSPYQPVPVATDTSPQVVLDIAEHQEDFPGVSADEQTLRAYPGGSLAAHALGYVGPVTQEELDNDAAAHHNKLTNVDYVGRSGLEKEYDNFLRGDDGEKNVMVDNRGRVIGTRNATAPTQGDTLVTSINQQVQAAAEKALSDVIAQRRSTFDGKTGHNFAAPSGSVVVLDPQTGRIIALASYPTFDPTIFVGGISQKELDKLTSADANVPLLSRASGGAGSPGSTFKLSTASAIVMDGQASLDGQYPCPPSLPVGGVPKTNYDSESLPGNISLARALAFSCDTFFYKFAVDAYNKDQAALDAGKTAQEPLQAMARQYGFGEESGLDLPEGQQAAGSIPDREGRRQDWEKNKDRYCANAKKGYPDVTDAARRAYLTQLASENCTDGYRWRPGDAADISIGQLVTVSPLQLALAYSALVNGGKLYEPTIGRAIVDQQGKVVKEITPKVRRHVPVSQNVLDYIRNALAFGAGNNASGEVAFQGFDFSKAAVGGKTGTAEVFGKQDSSWFASWSPTSNSNFVVVANIEQAGLGSSAAAPVARKVYEAIYGLNGQKPALPDGKAPTAIPPVHPAQPSTASPSASPSPPSASSTAPAPANSPTPAPSHTPSAPAITTTPTPTSTVPSTSPSSPSSTPNGATPTALGPPAIFCDPSGHACHSRGPPLRLE